jgi:DNA-binding MarR family transcriptional regulator
MPQLALFDAGQRLPARRSDPRSSHDAARELIASGQLSLQRLQVFEALARCGPGTTREIAARGRLERVLVARRMPELERLGLARRGAIRPCTAGGKPGVEWRAVGR